MFSAYYYLYGTLGILLIAFIPAVIAAEKEKSFSKWYIYGAILFPIALIHSLVLKKPKHRIAVFTHNEKNPAERKKKTYPKVYKDKKINISLRHLYMVFFSKLIFGAFVAFAVFAVFRTVVYGTDTLVFACGVFAVLFSIGLSFVEIAGLSKFPRVADEITKRTLIIIACSVVCSLPLHLIKTCIAEAVFPDKYADLVKFLFVLISFGIFLALILRRQRIYYSVFDKFADYTILSICAYGMFAAISLVWMSIADIRDFIYAVAMPTQVFNMNYLSGVKVIGKLSYMYSSVSLHILVVGIIFVSGLLCRGFKRKEKEYRVEYRSQAFRMSRKRILRKNSRFM